MKKIFSILSLLIVFSGFSQEHSGGIVVPTGFKITANAPVDDRLVVADSLSLYDLPNKYDGMFAVTLDEEKRVIWTYNEGEGVWSRAGVTNAKDVFFDNTESGLDAEEVEGAINELSRRGLNEVSHVNNFSTLPIFVESLNIGEYPVRYVKAELIDELFTVAQNQGITNDNTYYYTTENFSITKRLISDNSIVEVKNNPAGGNRLGGIFYDNIDNVLLVGCGSNSVTDPTAFIYKIDPDDLTDISGVEMTSELPGAVINAIFRYNDKIYVGQSLSNAPGLKGIYRLNLDLEVEEKVFESYKSWQDASVIGNKVYITDHDGYLNEFDILPNGKLERTKAFIVTGGFGEGVTNIGSNFIVFNNGNISKVNLTNEEVSQGIKAIFNSKENDSDIKILFLNEGTVVGILTKEGKLSLGSRLTTPRTPIHLRSPQSGNQYDCIKLENMSNTEGAEVSIAANLSTNGNFNSGRISHKHFGTLGRGWAFATTISTTSSYGERMWLLGDGRLLLSDTFSLLGNGLSKFQTDGGAYIKEDIYNEKIKAPSGQEYNVTVDDTGKLISEPKPDLSVFVESDELSAVAFSNSYNDLDDKPTIPTKTSDLTNDGDGESPFITEDEADLKYVESSDLAEVAFSNSYNDLDDKPTIPDQVNLIEGSNISITGTYPNLTISASGTVGTDLAQGTRTSTTVPITSSTGSSATLQAATTSLAGVMSAADKAKLDGLSNQDLDSVLDLGNTSERPIVLSDGVGKTITYSGESIVYDYKGKSITVEFESDNNYTHTLPNKNGTYAMLDDIPSLSGYATEAYVANYKRPVNRVSTGDVLSISLPESRFIFTGTSTQTFKVLSPTSGLDGVKIDFYNPTDYNVAVEVYTVGDEIMDLTSNTIVTSVTIGPKSGGEFFCDYSNDLWYYNKK